MHKLTKYELPSPLSLILTISMATSLCAQVGQPVYGPVKTKKAKKERVERFEATNTWERDVQIMDRFQNRTIVLGAATIAAPEIAPVTGALFVVDAIIVKIKRRRNARLKGL